MTRFSYLRFILATLALSPLIPGLASAAERIVEVKSPGALGKDLDAYPRIVAPADEAEQKINAALARLDAKVTKAVKQCQKDAKPNGGDWMRTIEIGMRGPRYLSYEVTDSFYCGGAHPESGDTAIVYDLTTGAPVDWSQLLSPGLAGAASLVETSDGTKMITLKSKRLYDLYMALYQKGDHASDKDCLEAVEDAGADEPPAMTPYLDAKKGGLGLVFDLPHVVAACADSVVVPLATLREEKTPETTLKAIEAAHAGAK